MSAKIATYQKLKRERREVADAFSADPTNGLLRGRLDEITAEIESLGLTPADLISAIDPNGGR